MVNVKKYKQNEYLISMEGSCFPKFTFCSNFEIPYIPAVIAWPINTAVQATVPGSIMFSEMCLKGWGSLIDTHCDGMWMYRSVRSNKLHIHSLNVTEGVIIAIKQWRVKANTPALYQRAQRSTIHLQITYHTLTWSLTTTHHRRSWRKWW